MRLPSRPSPRRDVPRESGRAARSAAGERSTERSGREGLSTERSTERSGREGLLHYGRLGGEHLLHYGYGYRLQAIGHANPRSGRTARQETGLDVWSLVACGG